MNEKDRKDSFNDDNLSDTISQLIKSGDLPPNAEWNVIGFGIDPSTKKEICVIKSIDKEYIMCAYQSELNFFRKVLVQ